MPTNTIFKSYATAYTPCPYDLDAYNSTENFKIWYESLPVIAAGNPYERVNSRCYNANPNHRHSLGRRRLQDLQKIVTIPQLRKRNPAMLCHLCYCFARLAGQKAQMAGQTVKRFNRLMGNPFTEERLEHIVSSAETAASSKGKLMYNYSNKTLVCLLGLEPYEEALGLKTIMSSIEAKRRVNERRRKRYARQKSKCKSQQVKKRRYSMFLRLLNVRAVGESFKQSYMHKHNVKESTFYADLQRCRALLAIARKSKKHLTEKVGVSSVPKIINKVFKTFIALVCAYVKRRRRC
ncbi:MAG: hypothetical protein IJB65_03040 [Clostridia bacterium]|nr:hypothetical protein [Clostridia bacterium]